MDAARDRAMPRRRRDPHTVARRSTEGGGRRRKVNLLVYNDNLVGSADGEKCHGLAGNGPKRVRVAFVLYVCLCLCASSVQTDRSVCARCVH